MLWEYEYLTGGTGALEAFKTELRERGALGWEICGFGYADKTIGLNAWTVWIKRPIPEMPAPMTTAPAWYPDPSRRFPHRYWDGFRWTQFVVAADGTQTRDLPYPPVPEGPGPATDP